MAGKLITLEGIDGCGKTTLAKALSSTLKEMLRNEIVLTKEPGGTPLGVSLRGILQTQSPKVCDLAEYLLFAADRAEHFAKLIVPALSRSAWVIADRLADSSVAYQGYGRGLALDKIMATNAWVMQGIVPDLTIYVCIDTETAFARIQKRNEAITNFEKEKRDFWQRVINGYEMLFKQRSNLLVIDGTLPTTKQLELVVACLNGLQWL